MSTTSGIGTAGEDLAARYLAEHGYEVLTRNWRPHGVGLRGEIDIVARRGEVIAIVEVKTRSDERFGGPLEAVTATKQRRLRRLAAAFLAEGSVHARDVRFDVVAIMLRAGGEPRVEHLEGAF